MIKQKNKNNKITIICLCIILSLSACIFPPTFCASADMIRYNKNLSDQIVKELDNVDFSTLNKLVDDLQIDNNLFAISNVKTTVYDLVSGNTSLDYSNFFSYIFSIILKSVTKYLPLLSLIVAIGVLSNLLGGIKSKFNEKSTLNLVHLVCFLSAMVLVVGIISNITNNAGRAIKRIVQQINVIYPILVTLMIGLGANASVTAFQPIVAIISTYVADFFSYFIIPLFVLSLVFNIVNNINDNIKLDKFNDFIMSLFKWSIGLVFTIFFAIFSIQGLTAGSFDGVSIRTTKYTIKSYIPYVGSYLADGMDLIMASSVLIKNAVGVVGILLIFSNIMLPIIEIAILSLMLKLITAVLQPLGNKKLCGFLFSTSKSLTILSTSILVISFMYIISLGMAMVTANVVL